MARTREEITREIAGYLLGLIGVLVLLAVLTYHPLDPSLFSAGSDVVHNLLSHGVLTLNHVNRLDHIRPLDTRDRQGVGNRAHGQDENIRSKLLDEWRSDGHIQLHRDSCPG